MFEICVNGDLQSLADRQDPVFLNKEYLSRPSCRHKARVVTFGDVAGMDRNRRRLVAKIGDASILEKQRAPNLVTA